MNTRPPWNIVNDGEMYTCCEACENVTLTHDRAIWTDDGASSYCPPCFPGGLYQKRKETMADTLKYMTLVAYILAMLPILLVVHLIVAVLEGLLNIFEDVKASLTDPSKSKLYRWMGWA